MKIILDKFDSARVEQLAAVLATNSRVIDALSDFVNNFSTFISPDMLNEITQNCNMPPAEAYAILAASACGLQTDVNQDDNSIYNNYFKPGFICCNPADYIADRFYRLIGNQPAVFGNWQLKMLEYAPCQAFVCGQSELTADFVEIPHIGFFTKSFSFPCVMRNSREWMAVKPNEIITMQNPLRNAHGNVLVYGLGIGYFACNAAFKESVNKVTVIENDNQAVELFNSRIRPLFKESEKIDIVIDDAFEYAEKIAPDNNFDYVFADIWHDTLDGFHIYLKLKRLEYLQTQAKFDYWIEDSILGRLRGFVFDQIYKIFKTADNSHVRDKEIVITDYNGFINLLSNNTLKNFNVNN